MLNIAIVGLGWWGRILVDLARTSPKLRVVRVADVNPQAQDFARERGLPFSSSFEDVLADPQVQAVVLATPHSQHTAQIIAAARSGRHVFCEKPLSMTRADVLRAVEAVEQAGVALAVGHEKRFEPPILEVMRLLREGTLGTPLQVEANFSQDKFLALDPTNWRLSGAEAPAGPMTATGIHLLDLAVGVFGEAESVLASVRQLGSRAHQRRHAGGTGALPPRRPCPDQRHAGHALRRSLRRLRLAGLGRGARQDAPRGARRLDPDDLPARAAGDRRRNAAGAGGAAQPGSLCRGRAGRGAVSRAACADDRQRERTRGDLPLGEKRADRGGRRGRRMSQAFDARELRQVLGAFTTGVTVITTLDNEGQPLGLTANSFSSVSLDPPLVLWSQSVTAPSHPVFRETERFVVNILADDQLDISNRFARGGADKFAGLQVTPGLGGLPLIPGCAAYLECRRVSSFPGGDHTVFLGQVERIERNIRQPLVFGGGRYLVTQPHDLGRAAARNRAEHRPPGCDPHRHPRPGAAGARDRRDARPGRVGQPGADHRALGGVVGPGQRTPADRTGAARVDLRDRAGVRCLAAA